ncbi:MAG: hypothetical protein HYR55_06165 [Acidobacteria bacterium]|nr:hypothetical protein [Acidobacteriota bacterium]MBI3656624.1 hypothetical protein [Acidobacteriota bacterium]
MSLSALEFNFDTEVFFADVARNVLEQLGWLDKLRLGLVDYESKIYASLYDDPAE